MSAIKMYYRNRWLYKHHLKFFAKIGQRLMYLFYNSYIPYTAEIGKNCKVAYKGMAVVVHARAKIGDNCIIGTCVTIGGQKKQYEVPVIGNNCYIASGAKIFGPIRIGDNCFIGANSVVTRDVADNCLVAGIPAKVIKENIRAEDYF